MNAAEIIKRLGPLGIYADNIKMSRDLTSIILEFNGKFDNVSIECFSETFYVTIQDVNKQKPPQTYADKLDEAIFVIMAESQLSPKTPAEGDKIVFDLSNLPTYAKDQHGSSWIVVKENCTNKYVCLRHIIYIEGEKLTTDVYADIYGNTGIDIRFPKDGVDFLNTYPPA